MHSPQQVFKNLFGLDGPGWRPWSQRKAPKKARRLDGWLITREYSHKSVKWSANILALPEGKPWMNLGRNASGQRQYPRRCEQTRLYYLAIMTRGKERNRVGFSFLYPSRK
jgi:hypothetical protein